MLLRSLGRKGLNYNLSRCISGFNLGTKYSLNLTFIHSNNKSVCSISNEILKTHVRYSSTNDESKNDDGKEDPVAEENLPEQIKDDKPVTSVYSASVPESIPVVPLIAINSTPVFPKCLTVIKVTDKNLITLLRRRINLGLPYAGIFVKKDKENTSEVVSNLNEVYDVGTFAEIKDAGYNENYLDLVAIGHRRIKIVKQADMKEEGLEKKVKKEQNNKRNLFKKKKQEVDHNLLNEDERLLLVDTINLYHEPFHIDIEMKALQAELFETIQELMMLNQFLRDRIRYYFENQNSQYDLVFLSDMGAYVGMSADSSELQAVLEEIDIKKRLRMSLDISKKELEVNKIQSKIAKDVDDKVKQQHKKYMLHEQLKAIKKELGIEKDDKQAICEKFKSKIANLTLPDHVKEAIDEELNKLNYLDSNSSEFNVSRNYLDWLTNLPWGVSSKENFNLNLASQILEEDHYGMEEVKQRILEFIAVSTLKGDTQGKILCFYGPPGTGKTSFAKSIARALNRKYYRFSVGGMSDVSEIKGHRRTYVGAMPGKIIQGLKKTKAENPLILIDEVDKLGKGWQGDPSSALLELLDPEQNCNFLDHYLDVTVDLSKVLFICTANVWSSIPDPLRDRMEMIEVSGYIGHEKIAIAKNYLIPKGEEGCGLVKKKEEPEPIDIDREELSIETSTEKEAEAKVNSSSDNEEKKVIITDESLEKLIRMYCRESGVRHLQKKIEQILRKAAYKLVKGEKSAPITITPECLDDYVGKPLHTSERLYIDRTPPGIAAGLAWNSMGGSLLYLETSCKVSRDELLARYNHESKKSKSKKDDWMMDEDSVRSTMDITGHLGDVMKESVKIAHTFSMNFAGLLQTGRINPFKVLDGSSNDDYDKDAFKSCMKDTSVFLRTAPIHVHVPEGATPKDGPSAGITMVTALMSLAMNTSVKDNVAMTGEVSLTGKVLPIGGLKEKVIAARRSGINEVIIPKDNKKDFNELSSMITEGLTVHFVSNYSEVFAIVFPVEEIINSKTNNA